MIRIGSYGINVSDRCFEVGKIATRAIKKTDKNTNEKTEVEEEVLTNSGYYSTLESALAALYRRLTMEAVKSYDGDLNGAVRLLTKRTEAFEKLIKDALPDFGGEKP